MNAAVPSDEEIITVIRDWDAGGVMTYVIRNLLRDTYCDITTRAVRRRLHAMERCGKVKRVPSIYVRQIRWAVTDHDVMQEGLKG